MQSSLGKEAVETLSAGVCCPLRSEGACSSSLAERGFRMRGARWASPSAPVSATASAVLGTLGITTKGVRCAPVSRQPRGGLRPSAL